MTVLMEIPSTDRNSDSNNNNNPRVIKSTSLNIMTDRVSLCNGNIPTSQSSPIIERHQKHSQSSLATTAAMLIKQSKDDGTLVHQENPTIHSTLEMNGPLGIPLTDCIHRPESPSEFVSVLRIGGSISTEIGSENSSSIENEIFFSHTPKGSLTNLTIVHDVKDNFSNHNCYNKRVSIPPLNNPGLIDCRVGCLSSVSRSIGDNETVIGLNALPSITLWSVKQSYLNNSITMPLCLIIASDAWYWYKEHIDERKECLNYNSFSEFLINLAIQNGGSDNITCNVIWLHKWKPTNLKGWNIDYPISSSRIRWPRHSRVTSLINLNSSNDILFRGPSDYIYSQMNQSINENYSKLKRSSSFNNNISNHYNSLTPRYSSPPRDIIYDSYL
ncbi:unnamed protein product [Heterobilharzia americana]|nr:unnamed protein product [Heterobilharzia americana]